MKILVTGGAGFIGKHLVKYLLEKNNVITIFDNFSNSTRKSVDHLIEKNVKIIEGDIINSQDILDATKNQDIVIHLAAKISVVESIKNPLKTFEINVDGTKNVLIACKKNNIKKIIIASSAAIYDEPTSSEYKLNEQSQKNPISPYGISKFNMEKEIEKIALENDIKYIILRFFNIYGIGQSNEYAGVISKFSKCIQKNLPLTIYGNGNQTRDFVAIKDIIEIINKICNLKFEKSDIFNIGNGETVSIIDLAKLMIKISKKNISIVFKEKKEGEIFHSTASIDKARTKLGYNPKIPLKQGIMEFLLHKNNI